MIKARCEKCLIEAEGKTEKEAADKLDHAIGLTRSRPCPGGDAAPVVFTQITAPASASSSTKKPTSEKKKSKK